MSASIQKIYAIPGLEVGVDAYYKTARDLLDDGQFGAAYVLTAFNYDHAENMGLELKSSYTNGNFSDLRQPRLGKADRHQHRVEPVPVRARRTRLYRHPLYLYRPRPDPDRVGRRVLSLERHALFRLDDLRQRQLRSGFANTDHVPSYTQVNLGISHEYLFPGWTKPTTLRFDVVNLFDKIYEIRDGSGIGVFAPQFGPRRGFFVGVSQKL